DSTARRQQRTLDSLIEVIRGLQSRIDSLAQRRAGGDTSSGDELAALRAAASAASADSAAAAQPRQARLGPNAQNPEISVTGDLRVGAANPRPAGTAGDNFVAREFEMGFQSALDPYATAKIFASFEGGEVSIEEGYLFFPVLPGHVRVDIGRFRQEIGELNRWHLHAVPEDEYPLVVRRYASDDGLIGTGVSLYWPLPFSGKAGTYELYVQGTNGDNTVLYAGGNRPAILSKLAGFWQLSRATYLMASASGTYGTNPDTGLTTSLAVLAARFTWRPPAEGMARELTVRGEFWNLHRSFSGVATTRYGGYADATWKLSRRYTVSTRWDWLQAVDPAVASHEWAITPALTYWQSEFVFLRALYEHARDTAGALHDRFTIQAVFAMGPHKHELF
ncbi:MAG: hypothetical protein ACHQU8_07215, partial [Gemmatimonadales bacterium]